MNFRIEVFEEEGLAPYRIVDCQGEWVADCYSAYEAVSMVNELNGED